MAVDTVLVNNVSGNAWVRQADGSLLALRAGMRVPVNAEVVTDSGANVQLQADGMPSLMVGENRQFQVTNDLFNDDVDPSGQTLAAQVDPDIARVLAAVQAGEDPFEQLNPTAAVTSGGGDGAGGSSFTRLMSIVESTSPLALAYPKPITPAGELPRMGGYGRADGTDNAEEPTTPTAPTLKVTINKDGTVSFNFSEKPVGFDATDVHVSNDGRIENLRPDPTDPTKWVADLIVPDNYEGDIVVRVPDGSYTNEAGVPGLGDQDTTTVDTLAPEADITIDVIAGDDVINKAESEKDVTITGTVGKDVKAGDTVTVTVNGKDYTTTVNTDGKTWAVDVPGAELANDDNVHATVTTTDAAGNSTTAEIDRGYSVSTDLPEAAITINSITDDDVINKAESEKDVTITGTVGKDVKAGDTVIITIGGKTYTTTVNTDGKSWNLDVPGKELLGHAKVEAKVTVEDAAGNTATANAGRPYGVDTDLPEAEINIDTITGDDVINKAESESDVTITGTVGKDVKAGDTVTVTVNGKDYTTTVNSDGKTWTVDVPGAELAQDTNVHAKVETEDDAGNTASAETDRGYDVKTGLPEAEITIDTIAGDDVINKAESEKDVTITGTVGKDVKAGDTVTVTVNGKDYTTTVNTDGKTWNVDVPGAELAKDTNVHAKVETEDDAGNTASAENDRGYSVNTTELEAEITIDTIAGDDVINKAESESDVTITGTVGKDVKAGDTVTVTVNGKDYTTTVNTDGKTWNVDVPGAELAKDTNVHAKVETEDDAGNTASAETDRGYSVNTAELEAEITIDTIAGDDVINKAESESDVTISGTVGKDVKAGDTVTVTVNGKDYTTTVNTDGKTWTVDVPGAELAKDSNVHAKVETEDDAGNTASAETDRGYDVKTGLPEAEITIDTIAGDDVINKAESESDVTITGTVGKDVKAGDTVTVTVNGKDYITTVNTDGQTWTVDVPGAELAKDTNVHAKVETEDDAGNTASAETDRGYDVKTDLPEAEITIDTIAGDDVIDQTESESEIEITGTVGKDVKAGDTVTVTVNGKDYTTTVNSDNKTWGVKVPGSELAQDTNVHAKVETEDAAGNTASAENDRPYAIDMDTGGEVGCNGNVVCSTNYLGYSKNPDADPDGSLNPSKDVGLDNYMEFLVTLNKIEERNGEHFVAGKDGKPVFTQKLLGDEHEYIKISLHASDKIFGNAQNELNRTGVETETDVTVSGATRSNAINDGEYPELIQGVGDKSNEVYVRADVWNQYADKGLNVNVNHDGGKYFEETEWKLGARYEPDINNPQKDEDGNVKYPLDNHPANGAELDNGNRVMEGNHDSQYAFSETVNLKPVAIEMSSVDISLTHVDVVEDKKIEIPIKDGTVIIPGDYSGIDSNGLKISTVVPGSFVSQGSELIYAKGIHHVGSIDGRYEGAAGKGFNYLVLEGDPSRYQFSDIDFKSPKTDTAWDMKFYGGRVTDTQGQEGLNTTTFNHIKGIIFTDGTVIEDGTITKYGSSFMEYDFTLAAVLGDDVGTETGVFLSFTGLTLEQISKLSISKDGQELQWEKQDGKVFIPNASGEDLEGINIHVVVPKADQPTDWSISAELQAKDGNGDPIASDSASTTDALAQALSLSHEQLDELSPAHLLHEEDELGLFLSNHAEHDNALQQNEPLSLNHDESDAANRLNLADILGTPKGVEGLEPTTAPGDAQRTAETVSQDQDKGRAAEAGLHDEDQPSLMQELGRRLMDESQKLNNPDL
ncbi:retention module-containing protein [Paenalcaligenes sp. Me52]|uniref:retention module-containing protein n=1 Tax=Paenalcaligenes sp. Me52 TaxID=3392038 RepID=UPI003D2B1D71